MPAPAKAESDDALRPEVPDLDPEFGTVVPCDATRGLHMEKMRCRRDHQIGCPEPLRHFICADDQPPSEGGIIAQAPEAIVAIGGCLNEPIVDTFDPGSTGRTRSTVHQMMKGR